jgi:hypothetical protein
MTPTERARAVWADLGLGCLGMDTKATAPCEADICTCGLEVEEIADHIRRAENDALERVASWLDKTRYSSALAKDVRAMKHEVAN